MPVALVTGASRGIGRAAAIELGRRGFEVVITARTVHEGQGRDDGDFSRGKRQIEGSLEFALQMVQRTGAKAYSLKMDLRDRSTLEAAVDVTLSRSGRIDVLVNNALDHAGNNVLLQDLTTEVMDTNFRSNALAPLLLTQRVLPGMIQQGGGRIINLISICASIDPPAPTGQGGWGVLYGMTKAAVQRIAGVVIAEVGARGIMCFSLDPGFVRTAVVGKMPVIRDASGDHPEQVPASAIAWLASSPDAAALNGQTVRAADIVREHGL